MASLHPIPPAQPVRQPPDADRVRTDSSQPARVTQTLEDTPFYVRSVLESGLLGEKVVSMHETLNVPRLVSPAVRFMLPWRMPRVR